MLSPRASPRSTTSTLEDPSQTQKLKESCDDCSASKVKCTREKPACQRCSRRGRPCVYATSRRSGRSSTKSFNCLIADSDDSAKGTQEHQNNAWVDAMGSSSTADAMMDAFTNEEWFPRGAPWPEQSPSELASSSIAFWTDLESTVEIDHAEANSLFGSVSDNSLTNNVPAILDLDMTADDAAIWTKPSGHDAMHTESTPVAPVAVMLPASGMSSTNNSGPETRDSCLMTATQLMLSLFPRSCSGSDVSLPLEMVLQQNRRAIDEATAIMDCQCVKDGYLASILSLTLLKTMAWYSAAVGGIRSGSICQPGSAGVRNIRCGSISNETVRRDAIDHESESQEDRSAAQQVMGELHHVQRLLKLMSNLLGNQGLQQGFSDSGFGSSKSSTGSWEGEQSSIGTSQLSQSMFNSLDEEIRGRFRAVSRATIERLRII